MSSHGRCLLTGGVMISGGSTEVAHSLHGVLCLTYVHSRYDLGAFSNNCAKILSLKPQHQS